MDFHSFFANKLNPTEDGIHKECRAKDPENCRKCHTGKFSTGVTQTTANAKQVISQEPWKVFKKGNKELFAYTVRGEGSGEESATKRQLADEIGCKAEEIDVIEEKRPVVKGKVPGEKEPDATNQVGGEQEKRTNKFSKEQLEKTAKVIVEALKNLMSRAE